jgi:hypothetical protein
MGGLHIGNRKRVFYESINTAGAFPDGRIKLDVLFRCEDGNEFLWTPPWRAVIDLSASAKYLEETNKPMSEWTPELRESYGQLRQSFELSRRIADAAISISATLHLLSGDSAPRSLFPGIPPDMKRKSEQIFFVLADAKDIDDFVVRLGPLIQAHRKYFNDAFTANFNRILKKLDLRLDDNLNLVRTNL